MNLRARRFAVLTALLLPPVSLGAPAAAQTGLLVVAHGATPGWNAAIPVKVGLLRDDAAAPVRAAAIAKIHRTALALASESGDSVSVIPVLISSGRIDSVTIPNDLKGLPIRYGGRPLSPLSGDRAVDRAGSACQEDGRALD